MKLKAYNKGFIFISWRFNVLCFFILFAFFLIIIRVFYLQIIIPDKLVHEGDMRSLRMLQIPILRGTINDRLGRPLAVSVPVNSVWADPQEVYKYFNSNICDDKRWELLANALSLPKDQLLSRINSNNSVGSRFVYLARHIHLSVGDYIQQLKLPGIYLNRETRRYYPAGRITSHVVGITDIDGKGIDGVEKSFNALLSGYPGSRAVRKDRLGRIIEDMFIVNRKEAHDLMLSIDERLQSLIYHELNSAVVFHKAESGTVVLINVDTGEILAMVNIPSYNPNNLYGINVNYMRNRAITDVFEPGSTIKPIVIIAALHLGIIKRDSILNTEPCIINGYRIKDVVNHSELSVTGILQKSSNVGVSKIALSMPINTLIDAYSDFGIGKSTNLGLSGEHIGVYPNKKKWSDIDRATFSYGYGFMITPLQLARVYATIGSFGVFRPVSIIRIDSPVAGKQVFPKSLVRSVINMMESVALPGGSGSKAAINGYRIAIKTGTTKKVGSNGKYVNKYVAYTAGVAPASKPRYALVVVINDPKGNDYYGGIVSAPLFSSIMSGVLRIMNVEPDWLSNNNARVKHNFLKK